MSRTSPISSWSIRTTRRKAKIKSRIRPTFFASSARKKGATLDLAHWRNSLLVWSNKGSGLKLYILLEMGILPRRLKLFLKLFLHPKRKMARVELATYAARRGTFLPHALLVSPHPILSWLMMLIHLVRMRLAMCLPNLLVLNVGSRKEPFGLPSLLWLTS